MLILLALLAGCAEMTALEADALTGGANEIGCVRDATSDVSDPTVPSADLDYAAQDALDGIVGSWSGTFGLADDATDGGAIPATMAVSVAGVVQVVDYAQAGASDTAQETKDATEQACVSRYEIPVRVRFAAGRTLEARFDATLEIQGPDLATLSVALPLDTFVGDATPASFDPSEMDRTTLTLTAWNQGGLWMGSWDWAASRDESVDGEETVSTGVIETLGTFEMVEG